MTITTISSFLCTMKSITARWKRTAAGCILTYWLMLMEKQLLNHRVSKVHVKINGPFNHSIELFVNTGSDSLSLLLV